jgi:hypothetical protein
MLKPIKVWFAKRFTEAAWQNDTWQNDPEYLKALEAIQQAAGDLNLTSDDGWVMGYQVTGDEMDDQLKLWRFQLPQVLFSTWADPNDHSKGDIFLAKLVQGQITRENIRVMLTACRRLERQVDAGAEQSFYDPSLQLLDGIGISNTAGAPGAGGYLLGLNPLSESLEVNRRGQIVDNVLHAVKKVGPWALLAAGAYAVSKK